MLYCAFISYSHADAKWANWLMHRLESYRERRSDCCQWYSHFNGNCAIADSRFKFSDVKFKDDTLGDLSWARGASDYIAVITDTDLDNENCSYSVFIVDNGAGGITLPCDPPITNKPRPPAA